MSTRGAQSRSTRDDLERLMVRAFALLREHDLRRPPREPAGKTPYCPPLERFVASMRDEWSRTEAAHIRTCHYCQKTKASLAHVVLSEAQYQPPTRTPRSRQHWWAPELTFLGRLMRLPWKFARRWSTRVFLWIDAMGESVAGHGIAASYALMVVPTVFCIAAAIAILGGHPGVAAIALLLAMPGELVDAELAHKAPDARRAVYVDYTFDRLADIVLYGAVAIGSQDFNTAMLSFAALTLALLASFLRAQAAALRFTAHWGSVGRGYRLILLTLGLGLGMVVPALIGLIAVSIVTATVRLIHVCRQGAFASVDDLEDKWRHEVFGPELENPPVSTRHRTEDTSEAQTPRWPRHG